MIKTGSIVQSRFSGFRGVGIVLKYKPATSTVYHGLGGAECVLVRWLGANAFPPGWASVVDVLEVVVP